MAATNLTDSFLLEAVVSARRISCRSVKIVRTNLLCGNIVEIKFGEFLFLQIMQNSGT